MNQSKTGGPRLTSSLTLLSAITLSIAMVGLTTLILQNAERYYLRLTLDSLGQSAALAKTALLSGEAGEILAEESPSPEELNRLDELCDRLADGADLRITLIASSGQVWADTQADTMSMDLHLDRPEIRQALERGAGSALRRSPSLKRDMAYYAINLGTAAHGVLRVSREAAHLRANIAALLPFSVISLVAIILVASLALALAVGRMLRPVERLRSGARDFAAGKLDRPIALGGSRELRELGMALNKMAAELSERLRQSREQGERAQAILNGMREAVIVLDHELKISSLNATAQLLFGGGRPGQDLLSYCQSTDIHRLASECLAAGEPREARQSLYEPGRRELIVTAAPVEEGLVMVINDISRLEKLEAVRRDFVANVSHELRTPITAMKGYLESLESGAINDPALAARFVSTALRQTERLEAIIEDLLSLARIEQNEAQGLPKSLVDLSELTRRAVVGFSALAQEKGMRISAKMGSAITAWANECLIEQALANLLDNAIKYSLPDSEIRVVLEEGQNELRLSVGDDGPGIPSHERERVFERFYRLDRSRSRAIGGTGLGLSIVKHIALAHSGRVELDSKVGSGSTFTIVLPRKPADQDEGQADMIDGAAKP